MNSYVSVENNTNQALNLNSVLRKNTNISIEESNIYD